MTQKIVLKSLINLSGSRAIVQIGDRPLATVYHRGGTWHAVTPSGTHILPPTPVTVKRPNKWGRLADTDVTLGEVIKTLRDRLEAKLAQRQAGTAQTSATA